MFLLTSLIASLVVFPPQGAHMPAIESCYCIGSVHPSITNIVIQGSSVPVYKTGGWVTMLSGLKAGTNTIEIVVGDVTNKHSFVVAKKPVVATTKQSTHSSQKTNTNKPPQKIYAKLPYATEEPFKPMKERTITDRIIYLDPGHGGSDTGALSPHGFPEKDANLRVAKEVEKVLKLKGIQVYLTRTNDVACALYDRSIKAHKIKADAFISIHHNAPGFETDPRQTRYHCIYSWNELGEDLSDEINAKMAEVLEGDIPSKGVLRANYAVTRSPEIASCLIEVDFLTTPEGEESVWCPPRRRAIGEAIANGIISWLENR